MGATGSKSKRLEQALGTAFPDSEHYFGLENFGNTCYCNSVLQARPAHARPRLLPACAAPATPHRPPQALYYCAPMRERCLEYLTERCAQHASAALFGG